MPATKSRAWNDVLDNLGENLIRLGASLSVVAEGLSSSSNEASFARSMEQIATGFRLAFRQARPALSAGEEEFVQLTRTGSKELMASPSFVGSERLEGSQTLVHEGILVCQEMVNLLNQIEQGAQSDAERTRQAFAPLLRRLAETTASAGWELRTVCHEYDAEARLAQLGGSSAKGAAPASIGLLHDMSSAAQALRLARREWFRAGQRLSSLAGSEIVSAPSDH